MSDKRKMNILGKTITLYTRPESDNVYFYFSHEGKKYKGSTGSSSFDDVRIDQLTIKIVNIIEGRPIKKPKKVVITFKQVFKEFCDYQKNRGTSKRTLYDYDRLGKFLIEFFGNKDITTLGTNTNYIKYQNWKRNYYKNNPDKATIMYYRKGKLVHGRTFTDNGPIAIDREMKLFRQVLLWCQKTGKIPRDTYIDQYEEYTGQREATKVLTQPEYLRVTEYLKKDNPYYYQIVRFLNNTGIRYPSELIALKWKHIDFDKHTISIEGRKRGKRGNTSRVDSLIPMTERVQGILSDLYNRPDIPKGLDDYVFVNDKGKRVKSISKYWNSMLNKLDIDTDINVYSLRHLFAIRMVKRPDLSLRLIAEWMGHSSITMIEKTYARVRNSEKTREQILQEKKLMEVENGG